MVGAPRRRKSGPCQSGWMANCVVLPRYIYINVNVLAQRDGDLALRPFPLRVGDGGCDRARGDVALQALPVPQVGGGRIESPCKVSSVITDSGLASLTLSMRSDPARGLRPPISCMTMSRPRETMRWVYRPSCSPDLVADLVTWPPQTQSPGQRRRWRSSPIWPLRLLSLPFQRSW